MHANRRLPNPPSRRLGSSSRRLDGSWRLAEQDGLWARWRWILADSRAEAGGESQEEGENSGRSGRFGNRGGSASDAGRFERGRGGRREADRNSDRNTRIKVRVHDKHSFQVAKEPVDLRFVEQLAVSEQTAALAQMVRYCLEKGLLERCTVQETVATLLKAYEADGLSVFSDASYAAMGLAMPRVQEIYACLNRFRG